jgi:phenylacetic acid degradation operon negative regulatory protein
MREKTKELLHILFWTCDTLLNPTFRNLTHSYEHWAYRNGLYRQLSRLEKQRWIESQRSQSGDRLYRLSEGGRLEALGGRDPEVCWRRKWDGLWRLAIYDVPEARSNARNQLRVYLRSHGFGYLQNSVWITPDPVHEQRAILAAAPANVESIILFEGCSCAGETNAEIVAGAWDFDLINKSYARHSEIMMLRPRSIISTESEASRFQEWLCCERKAWLQVMALDPLLPRELLPPKYRGRRAWALRQEVMREAGEQLRAASILIRTPS